jgi:hypothetical protein
VVALLALPESNLEIVVITAGYDWFVSRILWVAFHSRAFIRAFIKAFFQASCRAFRSVAVGSEASLPSPTCSERTPGRSFNSFFHSFAGIDASSS